MIESLNIRRQICGYGDLHEICNQFLTGVVLDNKSSTDNKLANVMNVVILAADEFIIMQL